jgi:sugar lactone lactonase YvrE
LVRELGVEYASPVPADDGLGLECPVVLQRAGGFHLIVDELATENSVPATIECRTLLLAGDGTVAWDSARHGFHDGYGCFALDGSLALMRRSRWDVLLLNVAGEVTGRIDLARVSKRMPRTLASTANGTLLVTFLTKSHELDIAEIDLTGSVLWYVADCRESVGVPGSVQALADDTILVADEFRHVVRRLRRDGSTEPVWGAWADPSLELEHLSAPKCAAMGADGRLAIADTNNHRVLVVSPEGVRSIDRAGGIPWTPSSVAWTPDGNLLCCDTWNRRALEVTPAGVVVWQAGSAHRTRRALSFPRSVHPLPEGGYLIADTANNLVVELRNGEARPWSFQDDRPLFWPRAACLSASGTILIADGRNSRVLEVAPDGQVMNQLECLHVQGRELVLSDPHDVRPLPNGNILIVDSARDLVAEADWSGRVEWILDAEVLSDPHNAQSLPDGTCIVCDSGHHRVLFARAGRVVRELTELRDGRARYRFFRPRYAEVAADGSLAVVDTGNNRVLCANAAGELQWELAAIPDSPLPTLCQPRWAHLVNSDEVLISDHFHHRILHLARTRD